MTRARKGFQPRRPLGEPRRASLPATPKVSEHALLRWLERVYGVDMKAIEREILADGRAAMILLIESGRIPVGEGVRLVFRDRVVLTVLD